MSPEDYENVEEIICPYCGHPNSDEKASLEFEDETNCQECDKRFEYSMIITYSTSKISQSGKVD